MRKGKVKTKYVFLFYDIISSSWVGHIKKLNRPHMALGPGFANV